MSPGEVRTQQGYVSEEALKVLEEAPRVLEEAPSVLEGAPRVLEEGSLTLIHIKGQVAGWIFQVKTFCLGCNHSFCTSLQSSIFDRLFFSNPVLSFPYEFISPRSSIELDPRKHMMMMMIFLYCNKRLLF